VARAADAKLLVAAAGGRVLGTVTFVPDGGPLGQIAGPHEAEFRILAVEPSAHGRGVGTALLRRVLDDSRRHGRASVVCSSLQGCGRRTGSTSGSGSAARRSATGRWRRGSSCSRSRSRSEA
jgi:GNAT superfamily N-acetyltransferase